jgi:alpha-ribazole phosphatase
MTKIPGQAAGTRFDAATQGIMPDRAVTRLHLLRHGEVESFDERVVRGQLDVPLSAVGLAQTERLARWLFEHEGPADALVGSDLARCRVLGDALAARSGLEYAATEQLREQHMGDWQGRTWADVTRSDPDTVRAYWSDYAHVAPPSGESFTDLVARVAAWWERAHTRWHGKRVWVATHVGVIRALSCHLLGLRPADALRLAPATASHTAFLVSEAGAVLTSFGERPWLAFEGDR